MSVITATEVEAAKGVLVIGLKDLVTPLARDRAKDLGVRIERSGEGAPPAARVLAPVPNGARTVASTPLMSPPAAMSGALYRRGAPLAEALEARPKAGMSDGGRSRP